MLLMVAGVRSWSDQVDVSQYSGVKKSVAKAYSQEKSSDQTDGNQATVSALALDAVITPAISFDFAHYFYFAPQPVWQFITNQQIVEVDFEESFFLFSCFNRIFARYIVTNAP